MSPFSETDVHREVLELLPVMLNGTLPAMDSQRLLAHLDNCTECRDEATALQKVFTQLDQEVATVDVDTALARVNARIDAELMPVHSDNTATHTPNTERPILTGFDWRSIFSGAALPWAGAAAALILVVAVNLQQSDTSSIGAYEVLSAGEYANPGKLLIDLELSQTSSISALTAHFQPVSDGADLRIIQRGPESFRLQLSGKIDAALALGLLERSRELPGFVDSAIANPSQTKRELP